MTETPGSVEGLPSDEHLALRVMPMPADLNPAGDVFGGWVMSMVDIAGGVVSIRRARSRTVTVAVNSFAFRQPVSVGDVISLYANVVSVGRSSITVDVVVYAERRPDDPVIVKVTEARLTYVAVDAQGRKRTIDAQEPAADHMHQGAAPSNKEVVLRLMPMPADLNPARDVFGGWIMAMVDIAGAIPAIRHARSKVATVGVDSFEFRQPVSVGDLLSFYAEIVHRGSTSVTVDVEVFAQRNPENPVIVKVTEARLTYVAVDEFRSKRT